MDCPDCNRDSQGWCQKCLRKLSEENRREKDNDKRGERVTYPPLSVDIFEELEEN